MDRVCVDVMALTTILALVWLAAVTRHEVVGLVVDGVPSDTSPLLRAHVADVIAEFAATQLDRSRVIVSASPTCMTWFSDRSLRFGVIWYVIAM